jgi:hypothetical protein
LFFVPAELFFVPAEKNESPFPGLSSSLPQLAVGDVHRDFETETHFGVLRLGPHKHLQ